MPLRLHFTSLTTYRIEAKTLKSHERNPETNQPIFAVEPAHLVHRRQAYASYIKSSVPPHPSVHLRVSCRPGPAQSNEQPDAVRTSPLPSHTHGIKQKPLPAQPTHQSRRPYFFPTTNATRTREAVGTHMQNLPARPRQRLTSLGSLRPTSIGMRASKTGA
ncbi:hypothetical protein VUR80DRAFT_2136 [Thermomyces stellatus]